MDELSRAPTRLAGSVVRLVAEVAVAAPVVVMDAAKAACGQVDAFAPSRALGEQMMSDLDTALMAGGKCACALGALGAVPFTAGLSLLALVPAFRAGNEHDEPYADLWGNRSPNPNA